MAAWDRLGLREATMGAGLGAIPGVSREIQKKHILGEMKGWHKDKSYLLGLKKEKLVVFFGVGSMFVFLVVFLWLVKLVLLSTYRSGTNLFFFAPVNLVLIHFDSEN